MSDRPPQFIGPHHRVVERERFIPDETTETPQVYLECLDCGKCKTGKPEMVRERCIRESGPDR